MHFVAATKLRGRDQQRGVVALENLTESKRHGVDHGDAALAHSHAQHLIAPVVAQRPGHWPRRDELAAIFGSAELIDSAGFSSSGNCVSAAFSSGPAPRTVGVGTTVVAIGPSSFVERAAVTARLWRRAGRPVFFIFGLSGRALRQPSRNAAPALELFLTADEGAIEHQTPAGLNPSLHASAAGLRRDPVP